MAGGWRLTSRTGSASEGVMIKRGCKYDRFLTVLQKKALQDDDDRAWIGAY